MTTVARVLRLAAGLMLASIVAAPAGFAAQGGTPIPAGGGEPGKVYLEQQKALKAKDLAGLKKVMSAQRVKEMADPKFKEMIDMIAEMAPTDVKILGGTQTGDTATLNATGKQGPETMKGEITLLKEGGAWKVDKESWKN